MAGNKSSSNWFEARIVALALTIKGKLAFIQCFPKGDTITQFIEKATYIRV
jgi:hypothetical protein